ncbi:hypothetical protein BDV96DRAFT_20015 [Lophiotrema nucula]|uniref:Zn(2)-C6 fungal-type domain-containing protein n=1 Tax=Lophiotrema nucula TaxID=690887 RepID=A0A6A5ZD92_9PLEO|nr:hypothetical protein BDV96DRAFT_20015 [Lophiotrema nucula]
MKRMRTRQDPVSCQSCRLKKLRCNRVQPCSNCAARGISCNFLALPRRQAEIVTPALDCSQVLERIERLESAILEPVAFSSPARSVSARSQQTVHNPTSEAADIVHLSEDVEQESHFLENIGTREDSLLPCLSKNLEFKISSVSEILKEDLTARTNQVSFPPYEAAEQLFQGYEGHLHHIVTILHIPTTRALMKGIYLRLGQCQPVAPGRAALILSIFALAAFFHQPSERSQVATTEDDTHRLSKALSRSVLDVLDYSRRSTSGSIHDIQAYIIMSLTLHHLDGFSARGRLLLATAAAIAKDLGLHRLDSGHGRKQQREINVRELIDREVKRRVFWYLAAMDWLMSTTSGPQEGTYSIQPNHVRVNLPKDCNDDDMILDCETCEEGEPQPQPTAMTFFLQKVRLAYICREITDTVPMQTEDVKLLPYDQVIALDKKLEGFINSMPLFFKLDHESRARSKTFETIYPQIPFWRYCITTAAHSRRCKLHQRFLLRQSHDPQYAYSRKACLESACAVIQVYEDMYDFRSPSTLMERMGMAVHFTHLALVVLVMDLCFNKNGSDTEQIKEHAKTALKIFQDAQDVSPLLSRCWSSLNGVMQKHNIHLNTGSSMRTAHSDGTEETQSVSTDPLISDTSFDEFWHNAFHGETTLGTSDWDAIFSNLDSRPI